MDNTEEEYRCSECGAEVKFDDKICPNCGANLEEVIDEKMDLKLEIAGTFANEFEASVAENKLKLNGIDCYISSDNLGGMRPQLSFTQCIRLMVHKKDLDKAINIIKDYLSDENYYETKCSHCGADVTLNKKEFDSGEFICPGCKKKNEIKK